jgi:hypothetical protein
VGISARVQCNEAAQNQERDLRGILEIGLTTRSDQ